MCCKNYLWPEFVVVLPFLAHVWRLVICLPKEPFWHHWRLFLSSTNSVVCKFCQGECDLESESRFSPLLCWMVFLSETAWSILEFVEILCRKDMFIMTETWMIFSSWSVLLRSIIANHPWTSWTIWLCIQVCLLGCLFSLPFGFVIWFCCPTQPRHTNTVHKFWTICAMSKAAGRILGLFAQKPNNLTEMTTAPPCLDHMDDFNIKVIVSLSNCSRRKP